MSEIPEDIREAADQIASDLDDIHFNSRSGNWLGDAHRIVAAALLTERLAQIERASGQIRAAREFVKRHPALTLIDLAEFEAFLKVEDIIRNQELAPTEETP